MGLNCYGYCWVRVMSVCHGFRVRVRIRVRGICYGFRVRLRLGLWFYVIGLVPKLIHGCSSL